jgi:GDP-D-mannose dehydratase
MAKPDVVYHFAAQSLPETSFYTPVHTLRTNIIGTTNLLDCIHRDGNIDPIIVSISSSEVYGNPRPEEVPISERNPIRAANPYSISKVGQDLMSQYYHSAFGLKIIITRMFSHEGARRGKLFALSSFANQIATHEKSENFPDNGPYQIRVGNIKSVRTYNHIDDAVRAYWLCIEKGKIGEVYIIGGEETCEVGEALDTLISLSTNPEAFEVVVDQARVRPTDITLQIPDCTKFKNDTGWSVTKSVKHICEDLLNYWRDEI